MIFFTLFNGLELYSCPLLVHNMELSTQVFCCSQGFMCTEELVKIGSWCVGRQQKQEALDYRVTKAQEVTEIEKVHLQVLCFHLNINIFDKYSQPENLGINIHMPLLSQVFGRQLNWSLMFQLLKTTEWFFQLFLDFELGVLKVHFAFIVTV
jgi:hypothetical protein